MEKVKDKLKMITDIWNDYVLDLKFFQSKINFTEDVQTNYFGEILRYYEDTFDSLKIRKTKLHQNHIFNMIGLLQVIYIQQDLTDELLNIFRIHHSTLADKNPNRELRNELVGHPIRRKKDKGNQLISSVFFGRELSPETIHYIRYSKHNDFKGDNIFYSTTDIINRHTIFLEKYFSVIIEKLNKLLSAYKEKLKIIEAMTRNNAVSFPKVVDMVNINFEKILDDNYLFKKDILLACYTRRNEHPRYQLATEIFLSTLKRYLKDTFTDIDNLLKRDTVTKKKRHKPIKINIKFVSGGASGLTEQQKENNYLGYELSKLHGRKHSIFDIAYFREKFSNNPDILEELSNMQANLGDNLEYYSSYEYIKLLLGKQDKT